MYDKTFFDKGLTRRGTRSEKWDDRAVCPENALPLWVADMDFPCAQPITDALRARAEHPCYGYTMTCDDDLNAVCAFWARRHGVQVAPEQMMMMPCVVSSLRLAVRALAPAGSGVIVQSPVYGPFFDAARGEAHRLLDAPLVRDENARYHMDLCAVEEHLKSGARLMLLCSPHNPVSRVWSRDELEALLALLARYDAALVCDEIHADFVYAPHTFVSSLCFDAPNVITLVSASKTFNIAGLQQSMLVCRNSDTLKKLRERAQRDGLTCGNIFALEATRAAYTACDDWLDGLLSYLSQSRDVLTGALTAALPDAVVTPIEATYLAWLDMRAYGLGSDALLSRFAEHGVVLSDGRFFDKNGGDGFIRLNFGCPQDMLLQAVDRMKCALGERK